MYEATKAMIRRGSIINNIYFSGNGIDIGAGPDCIDAHGFKAYNWDLKDGDAQYLSSLGNNSQDFVHSSHCLEHMVDPIIALRNWIRVCKPNRHLVVVIPDEELYEHNMWPSKFNGDHKWSFRIYRGTPLHAKSVNVFDLLKHFWKDTEIISVSRQEHSFNFAADKYLDQTIPASGPECSIEFVLRKK